MWTLSIRSAKEKLRDFTPLEGTTTLGRMSANNIQLSDESASREHAKIIYDKKNNKLILVDLASTNGTYLNGKRIFESEALAHDDQIRIGLHLITVISLDTKTSLVSNSHQSDSSTVSTDLLIESIEHYAVLLHHIGKQLNNVPDLAIALEEVSEAINRMIGSDYCKVITEVDFQNLQTHLIPPSIGKQVIENNYATRISQAQDDPFIKKGELSKNVHSLICVPVVIDKKVIGLIYAHKDDTSFRAFDKHDLQLLIAIGHQVALTIQRKKAESSLLHNANHDALTNLPNRNFFINRLQKAIDNVTRESKNIFAVLFIDLDNFKIINDSLGHLIGDKYLVDAARRISDPNNFANLNGTLEVVARFGGDEFAMLIKNLRTSSEVNKFADSIQKLLKEPFAINGHEILSTASIGITLSSLAYHQPEEMIRDADIAMYRAKEAGKAQSMIYDSTMHEIIKRRMEIHAGLRNAISNGELLLHYQPIVNLKTGKIEGFEALIRWESPDHGFLYPNNFLNTTDTTGLLSSIDSWVLQNACEVMARWNNKFDDRENLFIAVNLSIKQIKHPNLIEHVKEILSDSGLNPQNLWLELPESASIESSEQTLKILGSLRELDIQLCLDDFGTGFSSLSYLHKFPVNTLKIDQSFTKLIGQENESTKIIQTIVNLAQQLRMTVVGEGVETLEQLEFLRSLNTEYAQGYYFAKPMGAEEAYDFISSDPSW